MWTSWPPIKLSLNQRQACGLPEIPGSEENVNVRPLDNPELSIPDNRVELFHVGCPITLEWICTCKEYQAPRKLSAIEQSNLSVSLSHDEKMREMRSTIRKELENHYERTKLEKYVPEPVLEIDIELEAWRRKCFEERDRHFQVNGAITTYGYVPEDFPRSVFTPVGREEDRRPKTRSWPPGDYDLLKKEKNRYGRVGRKRKVPDIAPLVFSVPSRSKTCNHCRTQQSPLWRKGWRSGSNPLRKHTKATTTPVEHGEPVDLCNSCFIHWKRGTLVSNKKKHETSKTKSKKKSQKKKKKASASASDQPALMITIPQRIGKERETELRERKQYCPVCNQVYEDDDSSSFICCDACEMWIHFTCDPSLSK